MKLKRGLNLLDVFCIASGAMISSGLFILPGLAHAQAGPAVVFSYLFAGLLAMTGALSIAELATAMPKAGGDYFFITRSMGSAVGTVAGLLSWFSLSLKSAFALIGMAAFSVLIINLDIHIIAILLCLIFTAINFIGVKEASKVQVALVVGLLILLCYYVFRGIPSVNLAHFLPFAPNGLTAVFSTAGFVFVSYGGLLKVVSVAEEVKNPGRNIPLGIMLSLFVVSVFYAFVVFVTTGVLGAAELDNSLTPITESAAAFLGRGGAIALSIAAILAFISTANAGIMSASRYPLALSRDGMLPQFLGRVHKRFKTPYISLMVTCVFLIVALLLNLRILVEAASSVLILTYILSNLSIIILRESRIRNYQPKYRAPWYPWLQIVGILGFGFLLVEMGTEILFICIVLIAIGIFTYWFYGRIRANREYALLHLIKRIAAMELIDGSLDSELKEIIRERDNIIVDRFDSIIENCIILDIDEAIPMKKFFKSVSYKLSEKLNIKSRMIYKLLMQREAEGSTVIYPGLALPHIIVEGENIFDILICRCREGIVFAESESPVHSVFVIIDSDDERNFFLRVLSAIVQIVQNPRFDEKWLKAQDTDALRDLILLGKRIR